MDSNIIHKFESKMCTLCRFTGVNQYFDINSNFIEYNGIYHSLHEILNEALSINIQSGNLSEICLDCKDKVIKFYHFKRKVQETQKQNIRDKKPTNIPQLQKSVKNKQSKVVHNIYDIVKNYTEKCSIVKIRVNENNRKLIIESNEDNHETGSISEDLDQQHSFNHLKIKEEPESDICESSDMISWKCSSQNSHESANLFDFNDVVIIKQEPEDLPDITFEDYSEKYLEETDHHSSMDNSFELDEKDQKISKAALKMRKYREKLKLPENREKFLEHKERQKFWNRRHYLRKQARSSKYNRSSRIYNDFDNFFIS
ncbi:unnamed protein product [Chironomus riparius]|uniref:ZAD domain-containing protein n=1 Tax=Chironomus riparius TaxID=315576 RepID=A0A9N9S149_9DIPT|nr:unnamed protein product [Chironomus riparius]